MKKVIVLSMLLSGCIAANPDSIKPMSVSSVGYSGLSCAKLASEDRRVSSELAQLVKKQNSRRSADTVGVILLGVSPTGLGSPENSAAISRLKGERQTIASTRARKGCKA